MKNRVLIVDDDQAFCTALAAAIRRRGHEVIIAHNAVQAREEAAAWKPNRAVLDLRMPGDSGVELLRDLLEDFPELRAVLLTGYGSIDTAVQAVRAGAVHYLTKPAEVDQILLALEQAAIEPDAPVKSLAQVERAHIERVLASSDGNVSEAARRLGMHRRSLQRKLARARYGEDDDHDDR